MSNKLTPQEELNAAVKTAKEALDTACALAAKHHIGFDWEPAYGMGGYYDPAPSNKMTRAEALAKIASSEYLDSDELNQLREVIQNTKLDSDEYAWEQSGEYGWRSSSQNC